MDDAGRRLARSLDLPARSRPTVLLGLDGWRRRRSGDADTLAAHEVGHALGLPHANARGDLMTPGSHRCVPGVSASALEHIRGE